MDRLPLEISQLICAFVGLYSVLADKVETHGLTRLGMIVKRASTH